MQACTLNEYSDRTPLMGHIELTHKCSFKCEFCYNHIKATPELSTSEVLEIIDQVVEHGCVYINFSGGEPLLRKDFNDIYFYTKNKGVHVSLESNMYYIPDGLIELIKEYPADNFNISIYGLDDKSFQLITRSKCDFKRVLNNLDALLKGGVAFKLRTPISKDVLPILSDLKNYADSLGVSYKADPKIFWRQNGKRLDHLRISPEDVIPYVSRHHIYKDLLDSLVKNKLLRGASRCRWGINEFYINPYGELHYCNVYWNSIFDLKKRSFSEIWYGTINRIRKLEGDYCIGKLAAGTGSECPSGLFYSDSTVNTSLKIGDRLKNMPHICSALDEDILDIIDGN